MDAPRRRRVFGRQPYNIGAVLAAFALTILLVEGVVGWWCGPPQSVALEAKWAEFEQRADECDIVFIGTSHVVRHIDPRIVDQTLSGQGLHVRSHNLGLPKMSMLEGAELVDRLARRRPRRLKLVVLEPTLYLYDAENWATDRAMAEHDWSGTCRAARLTWASESRRKTNFWGKVKSVAPHWLSFLCRTLHLRRGDRFFATSSDGRQPSCATLGRTGFMPLPVDDTVSRDGEWRGRFQRFLQVIPDWNGTPLSEPELAYFNELVDCVRHMGATPVFLLGPKVKRDSHTAAVCASYREESFAATLLDYLRGRGDDDLYQLRYWHDFDHLNAEGAALFSRRLGRDLASIFGSTDAVVMETAFLPPASRGIIPEKLKRK